jgi:hypothetical protein
MMPRSSAPAQVPEDRCRLRFGEGELDLGMLGAEGGHRGRDDAAQAGEARGDPEVPDLACHERVDLCFCLRQLAECPFGVVVEPVAGGREGPRPSGAIDQGHADFVLKGTDVV